MINGKIEEKDKEYTKNQLTCPWEPLPKHPDNILDVRGHRTGGVDGKFWTTRHGFTRCCTEVLQITKIAQSQNHLHSLQLHLTIHDKYGTMRTGLGCFRQFGPGALANLTQH